MDQYFLVLVYCLGESWCLYFTNFIELLQPLQSDHGIFDCLGVLDMVTLREYCSSLFGSSLVEFSRLRRYISSCCQWMIMHLSSRRARYWASSVSSTRMSEEALAMASPLALFSSSRLETSSDYGIFLFIFGIKIDILSFICPLLMNQHRTEVIRKQKHRVLKPTKYSEARLPRKDSSLERQECRPQIRKKSIQSRASSKGRDLASICKTERRSQRRRLLKVNSTVLKAEVRVDGGKQNTTRRRLFDAQAKQFILQAIEQANSNDADQACKERMLKHCIGQFERALGRVQSRAKIRNHRLKEQKDTCRNKQNFLALLEGLQFQSVQIMPRSSSSKRVSKRASYDASQSIELQSNFLKMKAGKGYIKAMNPFKEKSSVSSRKSILQNLPLQFEHSVKKEHTQESSVMALSISEIKEERDSILTVFNRLEPFRIQQ